VGDSNKAQGGAERSSRGGTLGQTLGRRKPTEWALDNVAQSFTNLLYHVLFSTKDRAPLVTDEIELRLHEYLGGLVKARGGIPLAINGMPDHVHLLVKLRQDQALADFLRALKAISSGWVHDTFPSAGRFAWQNGYAAFTVSESRAAKVVVYIRNQKQHHKKMTVLEELKMLLTAHKIAFDEKYL
jgi:REP element-mobilizing transposase RayT